MSKSIPDIKAPITHMKLRLIRPVRIGRDYIRSYRWTKFPNGLRREVFRLILKAAVFEYDGEWTLNGRIESKYLEDLIWLTRQSGQSGWRKKQIDTLKDKTPEEVHEWLAIYRIAKALGRLEE